MVKQEAVFNLFIHNIRRIYHNNCILYSGPLDEVNFIGSPSEVLWAHPIFCDNTNAISLSKNLVMHSKTQYIPIKYHFLWEHIAEKNINIEYIGTKEQIADTFTKLLPQENFEYPRKMLHILPIHIDMYSN